MASTPEQGASGNGRAVAAVVVGLLSTATMPVAVIATRYSESYDLLHAMRHDDVRLGRAGGRGAARLGRALAVLGLALASTCLVALSVYGLLTYLGERG